MLYRAAMLGIIAFWLVMMGLLVRLETHPEATDILDVPVSFVMRLMFKHSQTSFLTMRDPSMASIGTLYLRPVTTGSDSRSMNFSGTIAIQLPTLSLPRLNFSGAVDTDAALQVRDFHVDLSTQKPPSHLSLKGDTAQNRLTYQMAAGDQPGIPHSVAMDAPDIGAVMAQSLGLQAFPQFPATSLTPPTVTAREAEIALRGEPLEVYQVTVAEGTVPIVDFYVTQLGQIVSAKTSAGYTLSAEE